MNCRHHLYRMQPTVVLLLCSTLSLSMVPLGGAGEQKEAPVILREGQIKAVKIDRCGTEPGTCEGSIVLAQKGGEEVTLAITPGTWIQRGDKLVLISDLAVGNYPQGAGHGRASSGAEAGDRRVLPGGAALLA